MKHYHAVIHRGKRRSIKCSLSLVAVGLMVSLGCLCLAQPPASTTIDRSHRGFTYRRDVIDEVPWSVNIVAIDRTNAELELRTTLGRYPRIGLGILSDQIKALRVVSGRPLAAINGDYYRNDGSPYNGDPKGLQIMQGELVSAPCDWSCFWIDPAGNPHMGVVSAKFDAIWPDKSVTPLGFNEERKREMAVLYSFRVGRTTGTAGGRELILEQAGSNARLAVSVGETYTLRVKEIREEGNSPTSPDHLVLSLSKELLETVPPLAPGALLRIELATSPDLKGVQTAIGGGPALVVGGRSKKWGLLEAVRHPRTAVGWNDKFIYLVEVDGRQRGFSVGMTYTELADYMLNKVGCTHALNLDGGNSSTMWMLGQVVNSPSKGRERSGANGLVLVQKPENEK